MILSKAKIKLNPLLKSNSFYFSLKVRSDNVIIIKETKTFARGYDCLKFTLHYTMFS